MQLWMAGVLFVIVAAVLLILIALIRRKGKKIWTIAAIAVSGAVLLAVLIYVALAFIFLEAASNQPPDEPPETSAVLASAPAVTQASPSAPRSTSVFETPTPETPIPAPFLEIPSAMSDDFDFPTAEVPTLYPDVLGLRNVQYEELPTFGTQNEVTAFVLYNFLNGKFDFELFLNEEFTVDEGTEYGIMSSACDAAMSYYLFSAYTEYNNYTEDRDSEDGVYRKLTLVYSKPEYDLEARAEALEFVMKNPVPIGGFKDFESEKAYARKIHDFIAKKIIYSPIGYDIESVFGMGKYKELQEAYNALAESETEAVCAGYARAFALIAQYAGINAAWVYGNETETSSHAWNVIYPCDGSEPVLVDVTWDDTESDDSPEQEYVSDRWFYIPLSEEYEHMAADCFVEFLRFINKG